MPTIEANHGAWNDACDWSQRGEQWTPTPEWKAWIVDSGIGPFLRAGMRVLEIGPGGGRWTEELLKRAPARLVGVDLSERCVEICRERFTARPEAEFRKNDGTDLSFIDDESVDFVWSFDVFVHLEAAEIRAYLRQLARVLASGGIAAIHYPSIDRAEVEDRRQGWRGEFTSGQMLQLVDDLGFKLLADFYSPYISETNSSGVVFCKL